MIKINTNYDNDTDRFTWDYSTKHSNTMEHLAVIQNLCDAIIENDKYFKKYKDIFKEVEKIKNAVEKIEEVKTND